MTVSGNHLRRLMRKWATGVTLVTAMDSNGPHGMTVSSFTAISLEPPLILVALERGARTHQMVEQVGRFAVVILRTEQRELADSPLRIVSFAEDPEGELLMLSFDDRIYRLRE